MLTLLTSQADTANKIETIHWAPFVRKGRCGEKDVCMLNGGLFYGAECDQGCRLSRQKRAGAREEPANTTLASVLSL